MFQMYALYYVVHFGTSPRPSSVWGQTDTWQLYNFLSRLSSRDPAAYAANPTHLPYEPLLNSAAVTETIRLGLTYKFWTLPPCTFTGDVGVCRCLCASVYGWLRRFRWINHRFQKCLVLCDLCVLFMNYNFLYTMVYALFL